MTQRHRALVGGAAPVRRGCFRRRYAFGTWSAPSLGAAKNSTFPTLSQAGFDGDLEAGTICPGGSRGSVDVSSEEVSARVA